MWAKLQLKIYFGLAFILLVMASLFSLKKNVQLTEQIKQKDRERKIQNAIAKAGANTRTDKPSVIERLRKGRF